MTSVASLRCDIWPGVAKSPKASKDYIRSYFEILGLFPNNPIRILSDIVKHPGHSRRPYTFVSENFGKYIMASILARKQSSVKINVMWL